MEKNYWLVGFNFGGKNSQLEKFIKEGIWASGFEEEKDQKQLDLVKKSRKEILLF